MAFGDKILKRGDQGRDVEELQIRLAGFRGTLLDGDFGPGTELQVLQFQRDFMKQANPKGIVDADTFRAIDRLRALHPIDFDALKCPCGSCSGFGEGQFRGKYQTGQPKTEAFHRYEYPGIHRMLLWAVRAVFHYTPQHTYTITSGYRCSVRNKQMQRSSTNHHGKAIDLDVPLGPGSDKRDDMDCCNEVRAVIVNKSNAQIGWAATNRKALEPADIAPTWVHYDVRCYEPKYLEDRFFCRTESELDGVRPALIAE